MRSVNKFWVLDRLRLGIGLCGPITYLPGNRRNWMRYQLNLIRYEAEGSSTIVGRRTFGVKTCRSFGR